MKFSTVTIAVLLYAATSVFAQNTISMEEFGRELKARNEKISTIRCLFTMTREMSVLSETVTRNGTFFFTRPADMLLAFDDGDYIKMTDLWFEMKNGGNVTATKISSNPMLKNLRAILSSCIAGDFTQSGKGFDMTVAENGREWTVTMIPQKGKTVSKIAYVTICFDKSDMSLDLLQIQEKSGDLTEYVFYQKKFNGNIDGLPFKISE